MWVEEPQISTGKNVKYGQRPRKGYRRTYISLPLMTPLIDWIVMMEETLVYSSFKR